MPEEQLSVCKKMFEELEKEDKIIHERLTKKGEKLEERIEKLCITLQTLQDKLGGFVNRLLVAAVLVVGGAVVTLCIWIFQYLINKIEKLP